MNEDHVQEERDALCPECGHAFKVFVGRILKDGKEEDRHMEKSCPVCGCGECNVAEI